MKRKRTIVPGVLPEAPVIADAIIEEARRAIEADRVKKPARCIVCGGECGPNAALNASEELCWVCRRLKLSAWRDSDSQMSAQE